MSNLNEFTQPAKFQDGSGHTLNSLDSVKVNEDLASECKRLRDELAQFKRERDELSQALDALIAEHPFFAPERLAEGEKYGLTLRQVIDQIEPLIHGSPNG